jgi:hypothetical protein
VKVGLRPHNCKGDLPSANFVRTKTQSDYDGEHVIAYRCEIVLHIHVTEVVAVRWRHRRTVCLYVSKKIGMGPLRLSPNKAGQQISPMVDQRRKPHGVAIIHAAQQSTPPPRR